MIPKPVESSSGPSDRIAEPSRNRLVTRCVPQTAISDMPNRTQVVGCVNAAAIPIRKIATRAPHEVRAASANATIRQSRNRTRDVVEVADVRRREEQAGRRRAS